MRALDLFCGAGGASVGIKQAGFDVCGVDINPQPDYPFQLRVQDAITTSLMGFDFVWASPPCQCFTKYNNCRPDLKQKYEDLIEPVRKKLSDWGGPYIIENVVGAPLINPVTLCGSMFKLDIRRHRLFESNVQLTTPKCDHSIWPPNRFPGGRSKERGGPRVLCRNTMEIGRWNIPFAAQKKAMGISWVTNLRMLSEAIPPVYSKYLAIQVANKLKEIE